MGWSGRAPARQPAKLARGSEAKDYAMSLKVNSAITVIGINIGKNSFHVVDDRAALQHTRGLGKAVEGGRLRRCRGTAAATDHRGKVGEHELQSAQPSERLGDDSEWPPAACPYRN